MYCRQCGTENDNNALICSKCGAPLQDPPAGQVNVQVDPALAPPKKKKRKGCLIALIVVVVLVIGLIAISGGSDDSSNADGEGSSKVVEASTPKEAEGKIGNYAVTIKDSRVTHDSSGTPILIVTYLFTNNSESSISMWSAISDTLFQNGVELGDVFSSYGIDGYSFDNHEKEIKPGVTLDVQIAYELNDTKTDVQVELTDFLGFQDPITYTIKINKDK